MPCFFESDERKAQLLQELKSWEGTPFRHRSRVKRKGVDCINLVVGVVHNLGVPVSLKGVPEYATDWHLNSSRELLLEQILKRMPVEVVLDVRRGGLIADFAFMDGDILLYRFGKASSHAAMYCQWHVYHSVTGVKVTRSILKDRLWYHRITHVLRLSA